LARFGVAVQIAKPAESALGQQPFPLLLPTGSMALSNLRLAALARFAFQAIHVGGHMPGAIIVAGPSPRRVLMASGSPRHAPWGRAW